MKGATCRQMQGQMNATNVWIKFCFQEYQAKDAWKKRDGSIQGNLHLTPHGKPVTWKETIFTSNSS